MNSLDMGLVSSKLTDNGLFVHQLTGDDSDIYNAYKCKGGLHMQSPLDTHYVMDGEHIKFIGNKTELFNYANKL